MTGAVPNNLLKQNLQVFLISMDSEVIDYFKNDNRFITCDLDVADFDNCSLAFCDEIILSKTYFMIKFH